MAICVAKIATTFRTESMGNYDEAVIAAISFG